MRPFLCCRYNPAVAVGVPDHANGKFAQVTAETVMSMSAPSRLKIDERVIDADALLVQSSVEAASLFGSASYFLGADDDADVDEDDDDDDDLDDEDDDDEDWDDEDEGEEDDEDEDEDDLGWDDDDEDEADEDDE